jgi:O-methyltransferase involved in polyketide biosynthesis
LNSRSADPILGDRMADQIVGRIDYDFIRLQAGPDWAIAAAVRAKSLDLWTKEFLASHPAATWLDLCCGLESRVFRVDPPLAFAGSMSTTRGSSIYGGGFIGAATSDTA